MFDNELLANLPNQSEDRHIGFQNLEQDSLAVADLESEAIALRRKLEHRYNSIAGSGG